MRIESKDMESNLPGKGFRCQKKGRDHIWFFHEFEGRETGARTKLSRTPKMKILGNDLITSIRKALYLETNSQVAELIECPMDGQTYNKILVEKGVFDPAEVRPGREKQKRRRRRRKRGS